MSDCLGYKTKTIVRNINYKINGEEKNIWINLFNLDTNWVYDVIELTREKPITRPSEGKVNTQERVLLYRGTGAQKASKRKLASNEYGLTTYHPASPTNNNYIFQKKTNKEFEELYDQLVNMYQFINDTNLAKEIIYEIDTFFEKEKMLRK